MLKKSDSWCHIDTPLGRIEALFDELNGENIQYCVWKSNEHLVEGLTGVTDLDLLVSRSQSRHFQEIVNKHGCKRIISRRNIKNMAIEDYLGYDEESGKLFHLHVYYQLIVGGHFVKNYQLPLEHTFVSWVAKSRGVKIAQPETELVMLSIRAMLKYRNRDVIKDMLLIGSPGLGLNMLREINYLLQRTTLDRIAGILKSEITLISPEVVLGFLTTVSESPRSGYKFYQLRKQVRRDLVRFQTYSPWKGAAKYFSTVLCRRLPFLRSFYSSKKKPESGGLLIALVGADGAGKSTIAHALCQWLSWKVEAHVFYMGSGERLAFVSPTLRSSSRILARLHKTTSRIVGQRSVLTRAFLTMNRFTKALHYVLVALSRYRCYRVALRKASQGSIIICDRYPLAAIDRIMRDSVRPPMDGPRIACIYRETEMKGLTAAFSKIEQNLYQHIRPPDYLLLLHVSPDVSRKRKPELSREEVEAKIQAVESMDRGDLHVTDIDADQPFDHALLQVKSALWNIV